MRCLQLSTWQGSYLAGKRHQHRPLTGMSPKPPPELDAPVCSGNTEPLYPALISIFHPKPQQRTRSIHAVRSELGGRPRPGWEVAPLSWGLETQDTATLVPAHEDPAHGPDTPAAQGEQTAAHEASNGKAGRARARHLSEEESPPAVPARGQGGTCSGGHGAHLNALCSASLRPHTTQRGRVSQEGSERSIRDPKAGVPLVSYH